MSVVRSRTVETVCDAHKKGLLDPTKRGHVLAQLEAEGHKRVESFLFEQIFVQRATAAVGEDNVSVGWFFVYGSEREEVPQYWFKLDDPTKGWNYVDDAVVGLLAESNCDATAIEYISEENAFYAQRYDRGRWSEMRSLQDVFGEILGRDRPRGKVRNYGSINKGAQRAAISAVHSVFSDGELQQLSLSRTLVNCYVYPWFAKQPMDLDLCYSMDGRLRFVEFKRKYPAASGAFGIDERPHGVLSDWLEEAGAPLLHVILCDPLWRKDASPTHLLGSGSATAPHAVWLGAVLDHRAFPGDKFRTSGADSGMLGGNRDQRVIRGEVFRLLGEGLAPDSLARFLKTPETSSELPQASVEMLERERDRARRAYRP